MMTWRQILGGVLVLSWCLLAWGDADGHGRNPGEIFGPNVLIFGPESTQVQETISAIYSIQAQKANEFGEPLDHRMSER